MLEKERDILRRDERPQSERRQLERESERGDLQGRHSTSPMAQMERMFDEVFKKPFFSLWSQRMAGGGDGGALPAGGRFRRRGLRGG